MSWCPGPAHDVWWPGLGLHLVAAVVVARL